MTAIGTAPPTAPSSLDLAEALERPTPAICQHLAKLLAGHLLATRREGTTVLYAQANELVAALVTNVLHDTEHSLYPSRPTTSSFPAA